MWYLGEIGRFLLYIFFTNSHYIISIFKCLNFKVFYFQFVKIWAFHYHTLIYIYGGPWAYLSSPKQRCRSFSKIIFWNYANPYILYLVFPFIYYNILLLYFYVHTILCYLFFKNVSISYYIRRKRLISYNILKNIIRFHVFDKLCVNYCMDNPKKPEAKASHRLQVHPVPPIAHDTALVCMVLT